MALGCEVEDHLHRLRSDLSSLLHQIDELVVQAIEVNKKKPVSKEGKSKIESFSGVLSDILSSLKPWVPRFQNALPTEEADTVSDDERIGCECDSPHETTLNLVSPSPLVSWRANCTVERGRQMFMLTPLPLSSKHHQKQPHFPPPSTSTTSVVVKQTPIKQIPNNQDGSVLVMMTPCFKMSPPKSCILLEPISEMHHLGDNKVRKATPYPVGVHFSDSEDSESPGGDGLALMYPELLGINGVSKVGIGKKTVEASPDWFTSPPKTCVLLEPPDEKIDDHSLVQITGNILNEQVNKLKDDDDVSKDHNQAKKLCNQDLFICNLSHIESTPMPESSFRTGKRPGENTLKKELWTKFEAASTWGCQPKLHTVQKNTQKGFLDLLEEASCDE
ncbi:hypothetical protein Fmac_012471 [Flemingia macrophylla]|uniref:Uncharacterized protein n=1 Tax=Flemingia macrophylla TaxID=520843 RepID=A0ABD1MQD4_9FABA